MSTLNTIKSILAAASLLTTLSAPSAFAQDSAPAVGERAGMVDFVPASLVDPAPPSFPGSFSKPRLVLYPGMPASAQPGPDWTPEHGLWRLPVRVSLDARGTPIEAEIGDHPLNSQGMVRRYERLALRAALNWTYAPARVDGEPIASELILPFYFDTALGRPLPSDGLEAFAHTSWSRMPSWRTDFRVLNR